MDLDGLKDVWQSISAKSAAQNNVSQAEIKTLIKGKTQNALSKIWRNILMEIYVAAAMLLVLFIFGIISQSNFIFFILGSVSLLIIATSLYFAGKFRKVFQLTKNLSTDNLRQSLEKLSKALSFYLKVYFIFSMLALPIGLALGFLYAKYENGDYSISLREVGFFLIILLSLGTLLFFLLRIYLNALYGKYINELKAYLAELN